MEIKIINIDKLCGQMASNAGIKKATVRCKECGAQYAVNGAYCLQNGWPKCCGFTMTLISPEKKTRRKK